MAKAKAAQKKASRRKKAAAKSPAKKRKVKKRAAKPAAKAAKPAAKAAKPAAKAAKRARGRKKKAAPKRAKAAASKPLTLTEVSKRTGISMPTLQRYKKEFQRRLPTVGKGRTQRYPIEALEVFQQIKKENLKKRGRPRKSAAKKVQRGRARQAASGQLISLSEIGRRTGISYPTLLRYVRLYGDRIPSHGTGRKRRFPPSAVPVFRKLRKESRRGRRKGAAKRAPAAAQAGGKRLTARLRKLEARHAKLEKQLRDVLKALKRPLYRGR